MWECAKLGERREETFGSIPFGEKTYQLHYVRGPNRLPVTPGANSRKRILGTQGPGDKVGRGGVGNIELAVAGGEGVPCVADLDDAGVWKIGGDGRAGRDGTFRTDSG